jgi:DNA adenine methylase
MSKDGPPRRLYHFTPLRYPGGKGKLAGYLKEIIRENKLFDGEYVEPYAGGAAIGLELLLQEYVTKIHINDLSQPIYSFWKSVLNDTEELCRLVKNTRLTVASWDRQKRIFANPKDYSYVQLGFATFFLNRTNRSGILNGGIIGGRDQTGSWKIDARYNADELIFRIESIANLSRRIRLTRSDALAVLRARKGTLLRLLRAKRSCRPRQIHTSGNERPAVDCVLRQRRADQGPIRGLPSRRL